MRLYLGNTYLYNHTAKVTLVGKDAVGDFVELDETIFHPQGGGQPSDQGTIGGVKLKKAANGEIIKHYLEASPTFKAGDSVELIVDREKRLQHAVLHTTGHLLASVIRERFNFKNQTAGHHFPGECRVVFKADAKVPTEAEIMAVINSIAAEARAITVKQIDGERHIDIPGFEPGRCAGTHLSNTVEIKDFALKKPSSKKGEVSFGYTCTYNLDFKPNAAQEKRGGAQNTDLFRVKAVDVRNDNNAKPSEEATSTAGLNQ